MLVCVNLDAHAAREGLAIVPASLGLPPSFTVQDLLSEESYAWHMGRNYVMLAPGGAHVMHVR